MGEVILLPPLSAFMAWTGTALLLSRTRNHTMDSLCMDFFSHCIKLFNSC